MSHWRIISIFLGGCLFLNCGCTSSRPKEKVHHHGPKINISEFMSHTAAYKGKTITLLLKVDLSGPGKSLGDHQGSDVKFMAVGPKGEHLNLVITIPEGLTAPDAGQSDDVVVTFFCQSGQLRQGNVAKSIQPSDGSWEDLD
jgi:hypothetical protein